MSGFLKYYAAENARHQDVLAVKWTFSQCKEAVNALCDHLKLPRIPVRHRIAKKQRSWYSCANQTLTLHETMMNPLTVAHEVAHYQDHMYRLAEKDRKNAKYATQIATGSMRAFGIDNKTRWHGLRHLNMTDRAVAFVKTLPFYTPFKQTRMTTLRNWTTTVGATASDIVQAAYDKLHDFLHCPKCDAHKHKVNFGMRVTARDSVTKLPTKVIRQSYCRKCRSNR